MLPLNFGKSLKFDLPTGWHDVSTKMFFELKTWAKETPGNYAKLFSVLSGLPYESWAEASVNIDQKLWPYLDWFDKKMNFDGLKVPEYVTVWGKTMKVPHDMALETFGQKALCMQHIQELLESDHEEIATLSPRMFAYYMQPYFDEGPFDEAKAEAFIEKVEAAPILEVYPVGNFFLKGLLRYMTTNAISFKVNTQMKNLVQASQPLKNTGYLQRLTRWLKATLRSMKKS